jgi:hypothetical protein
VKTPFEPDSGADVASANLRLVEAVLARRRTLHGWPRIILLYLQRRLGRPPICSTRQAAEAQVLLILARCYGPAILEAQPLRIVVDLIALQGEVTVVQRSLWGVAFADDALQKVLADVVPEFKALVARYPTVFYVADSLVWTRPESYVTAEMVRHRC